MKRQHHPILRWIQAVVAACAVTAFASDAHARTETIRWTHPDASRVTGFRIHVGTASGAYGSPIEARKPTPLGGVYAYNVVVADQATAYVALTAYASDGAASVYSNERVLLPPPVTPPPPPPPPPVGGTPLYFGDFEGQPIGSNAAGWYDTGVANSLVQDDSLFSIGEVGGTRTLSTTSSLSNVHSHFDTSASRAWSGYEYRGRMRIEHPDAGIGVTSHSQYPNADAYYRIRRYANARDFHLYSHPHPSGLDVTCSSSTTGVVPAPNVWYEFRFLVFPTEDRTIVRARVWSELEPEPPNWQIDCEDTRPDRLVSGSVGVWSLGEGAKHWDDLEVVDLGDSLILDPPPKPVLNLGQ